MRLAIRQYGDPVLRAKGARIDQVDGRIRQLSEDMLETMHAANGVGLAAQQVGEALQLTVIDVSQVEDRPSTLHIAGRPADLKVSMPLILLNPVVTPGRATEIGQEGCLSFPEITADIERPHAVALSATTLDGEKIELEATGLLARAIQHEVDHLNGVLFIDRMNSAAKVSLNSRLKRLQKETQRYHTAAPPAKAPQRAL